MHFSVNFYLHLAVFGCAVFLTSWFSNTATTTHAFLLVSAPSSAKSKSATFRTPKNSVVPMPDAPLSSFSQERNTGLAIALSRAGSSHELRMGKTYSSESSGLGNPSRRDHIMEVLKKKSVGESPPNDFVDVDPDEEPIKDFIHTEALLTDPGKDLDLEAAMTAARQACSEFMSDVNVLQVIVESEYLSNGEVKMPNSGRVLKRDAKSTETQLSNDGLALLIQASIDDMAVATKAFEVKSFTKYSKTDVVSKSSFNKQTILDTLTSLLTGFSEGAIQGIQSAAVAVGTQVNRSVERTNNTDTATTLNTFIAHDHNAALDIVESTFQTILFEFEVSAWTKIEKSKKTSKIEEVNMSTIINSNRQKINLNRLVEYYKINQSDFTGDENPVVPGGNFVTLPAYGFQLKQLPKPDAEYVNEVCSKTSKEIQQKTGVRASRQPMDECVSGSGPSSGLRVIRTRNKCEWGE